MSNQFNSNVAPMPMPVPMAPAMTFPPAKMARLSGASPQKAPGGNDMASAAGAVEPGFFSEDLLPKINSREDDP